MKKLLMILGAGVLLANSASAVSLSWKSDAMSFDGTALKSLTTGITAYVVYLSSGSLSTSYKIDDDFSAASVGTVVSSVSKTSKGSAAVGTFQFDYGAYNNNDKFAMIVSYAASDGKTYWNVSETINTLSGISDELSTPTDWNTFAVNNSKGTPGTASGGSGWTAVPEPSTAALALAGLALLLKRRKA